MDPMRFCSISYPFENAEVTRIFLSQKKFQFFPIMAGLNVRHVYSKDLREERHCWLASHVPGGSLLVLIFSSWRFPKNLLTSRQFASFADRN